MNFWKGLTIQNSHILGGLVDKFTWSGTLYVLEHNHKSGFENWNWGHRLSQN